MNNNALPRLDWRVVFNRATPPGRKGWGRVRAAQFNEMGDSVSIATLGQGFNAVLLVLILHGTISNAELAGWLTGLAIVIGMGALYRRRVRGREIHSISRRAIDRTAYHSVFFGAVWAIPALVFFDHATHSQQLAIGIVTASMMAGAAFIFTTVPPAAAAYVVTMGAAASSMLSMTGSPVIAAIGPIYTAGLFLMVLANGRTFMQRKSLELALEERTDTVSLLLREYETSDADWLWQTNRNLELHNVSARFARAIGREADQLEGMSIIDLVRAGSDSSAGADEVVAAFEKRGSFGEVLVPFATPDGTICIELSARPRFTSQGRFVGYQGVGSDVTEAQQAADRIAHMARHDALTGLPNRLHLVDALGQAVARAEREDGQCAILLIDLDRFKTVNDSLGHVAGDRLLQQVSTRISPLLDREMTAGRLGGDEFAIVIPHVRDVPTLQRLAFALIEALKLPFVYEDQYLFVGASIGLAIGPGDGATVEDLIRNADLALYRAKDEGGNDVCFYESALHARAEERRRLEVALRAALENDEFSLVYQPVVDAKTSRIGSFEALLRWSNPELGRVPPMDFVPIAEETGLLGRIGEWVLRTACAEAARWPDDISIAVNVSPRQLQEPGFIVNLMSALGQSGLDPHRLELELTETVFLNVTPETQKVLQQIHSLGVRLAMDDFGTGYSSLGYLRQAHFDTLKIDRSFVQSAYKADSEGSAIIRAVVALAQSMDMKTVAEGVETPEQLELVRQLGCDKIQGYIFSRPIPGPEARALLGKDAGRAAA